MIYAVIKDSTCTKSHLFDSWPKYHTATFCPDIKTICLIELGRLSGKTYIDRKNNIQDKAIEFSNNQYPGLSYSELFDIQSYFLHYGKRYGLLNEFRENGIC